MTEKIGHFKRRLFAFGLGVLIILVVRFSLGLFFPPRSHVFQSHTMGTRFVVKIAHEPMRDQEFFKLQEDVDALLLGFNQQVSHYDPHSELSRMNASHNIEDVHQISSGFAFVLQEALRMYEQSDGYFDVTVAPLVNLWGFGPLEPEHVPTSEDVRRTLALIGSEKIHLEGQRVQKRMAGVELNLSAIAKGYAVDLIAQYLESKGYENFMIEIGGETFCSGKNPDNKPWTIGIEMPSFDDSSLQNIVCLDRHAMATSGDYRNFIEQEGRRYSHMINPKTGYPVNHNLASVSVIAETCLVADAAATAAHVMGLERGYDWVNSLPNVEAYFIQRNHDTSFSIRMTPGFKSFLWKAEEEEDPVQLSNVL